jgi:hypothetical protein
MITCTTAPLMSIGHFPFFRKESEDIFWHQILQFVTPRVPERYL